MSLEMGKIPSPKDLKGLDKFQYKMGFSYEIFINIGSTFFLLPCITISEYEPFSFDWLWLHIGISKCQA